MPTVLVVEDDSFLAKAYQMKLSKVGFEVLVANDGIEALEQLAQTKPDIMLLDLVMPRKDGFETLQEIQQHPDWKSLPIIVASNLGQQEDIDRAKKYGATEFVIKSDMSLEEIINRIKTHLPADS